MAAASGGAPNFYLWGAMGSASMAGSASLWHGPTGGWAVFTGDGEMLMGLGSLATIGVKQPSNLAIVVLDNQHYGETGMQPSHTHSGISLVDVALGCCFKQARSFGEPTVQKSARAVSIRYGRIPDCPSPASPDSCRHRRILASVIRCRCLHQFGFCR